MVYTSGMAFDRSCGLRGLVKALVLDANLTHEISEGIWRHINKGVLELMEMSVHWS